MKFIVCAETFWREKSPRTFEAIEISTASCYRDRDRKTVLYCFKVNLRENKKKDFFKTISEFTLDLRWRTGPELYSFDRSYALLFILYTSLSPDTQPQRKTAGKMI